MDPSAHAKNRAHMLIKLRAIALAILRLTLFFRDVYSSASLSLSLSFLVCASSRIDTESLNLIGGERVQ